MDAGVDRGMVVWVNRVNRRRVVARWRFLRFTYVTLVAFMDSSFSLMHSFSLMGSLLLRHSFRFFALKLYHT